MSRVPSVTSGKLGQFVRRARQNAFDLQTVGGTSLERQIQSLFGGTQVKNLPPVLQQLIAEDRALGGGGGSGPLTLVNPFTNDDLTPDEQKAAANQMAIQQGANPPFPEVQQPQEQDSVVEAARRTAAGLQPGVDDGTITEQTQQSFVKATITNHKLNAKRLSTATRDVRALVDQSGDLTLQAIEGTKKELIKKFGQDLLDDIPEWSELDGTSEKFLARINEKKANFAAKYKMPIDSVAYNPKTGQAVFDDNYFAAEEFKTEEAAKKAKPIIEANRISQKIASERYDGTLRLLQKDFSNNVKINSQVANQQFALGMESAIEQFEKELSAIRSPSEQAAAQSPAAQPQAAAPLQGLPPGVALFGTFPDPQSALNANPPPDSYFIGAGALYRVRLDGQLEAVQ